MCDKHRIGLVNCPAISSTNNCSESYTYVCTYLTPLKQDAQKQA